MCLVSQLGGGHRKWSHLVSGCCKPPKWTRQPPQQRMSANCVTSTAGHFPESKILKALVLSEEGGSARSHKVLLRIQACKVLRTGSGTREALFFAIITIISSRYYCRAARRQGHSRMDTSPSCKDPAMLQPSHALSQ